MRDISLRPTVFLGLGGTGLAVLLRLKRDLTEKLGTVPPCFAFLAIDTTEPLELSLEAVRRRTKPEEVKLELGADRHIVQLANIQGYINDPIVSGWWPNDLPMLAIRAGANQVRANGRLAFFADYQEISAKIREKINKVIDIETTQAMIGTSSNGLRFLPSDRDGIDVYIVSSLAGGTGGGMLLDTAFVVRSMIEEISTITGILVMPKVFSSQATSALKANAYGALKELEHFMKIRSGDSQAINYGSAPVEVNNPPFDWVYLLDNINGGNGGKNKSLVSQLSNFYDLVSRGLFTLVASPIGSQRTDDLENLRRQGAIRKIRGSCVNYGSFGVARLRMPSRSSFGIYENQKRSSARGLVRGLLGSGDGPETTAATLSAGLLLRLGLDLPSEELARRSILNESGSILVLVPEFPANPSRKGVIRETDTAYDNIVQRRQAEAKKLSDAYGAGFALSTRSVIEEWWQDTIRKEGGFTLALRVIAIARKSIEGKAGKIEAEAEKAENALIKIKTERERLRAELKDSTRLTLLSIFRGYEEVIQNGLQNLLESVRVENRLFFEASGWSSARDLVKNTLDVLAEREQLARVHIKYLEQLLDSFPEGSAEPQALPEKKESFDVLLGSQGSNSALQLSAREFLRWLEEGGLTLSSLLDLRESDRVAKIAAFVDQQYGPFSVGALGEALSRLKSADSGLLSRSIKWFSDLADPLWSYDKSRIPLSEVGDSINGLSYCEVGDGQREVLSQYGDALSSFQRPVSFVNFSGYDCDDEAVLFKVEVGIPLFALQDIRNMKISYDNHQSTSHINRNWVSLPDLVLSDPIKGPAQEGLEESVSNTVVETVSGAVIDDYFYFSVANAKEPFGLITAENNEDYYLSISVTAGRKERRALGKGRGEAFTTLRADALLMEGVRSEIDGILKRQDRNRVESVFRHYVADLEDLARDGAYPYAAQVSREIESIHKYLIILGELTAHLHGGSGTDPDD